MENTYLYLIYVYIELGTSKDMGFASAAALPAVVLTAMHAVNLAGARDLQGQGREDLKLFLSPFKFF